MTLGSVLKQVLDPLGLKCVPRFGVLAITPEADRDEHCKRLVLGPGELMSRRLSWALWAPYHPNDFQFTNSPVREVFQAFADKGIVVQWNPRTFPQTLENAKVTCNCSMTYAANALEVVLDDLDLYGVIENNIVQIFPGRLPEQTPDCTAP